MRSSDLPRNPNRRSPIARGDRPAETRRTKSDPARRPAGAASQANPKFLFPPEIAESHALPTRRINRGLAVQTGKPGGIGAYGAGAAEEARGDAGRHFAVVGGGGGGGRGVVGKKKGGPPRLAANEGFGTEEGRQV
jgi:hypothetical protein